MPWPFSRRHEREDAAAVAAAREKRDDAFAALDEAEQDADHVHDRIVKQYETAEQKREKP